MGMSSVLQKKSRHATICFLSCKTRAQKIRTGEFLHKIEELKRGALIRFATPCARRERQRKRVRQCSIQAEMSARIASKRQEEGKDRKQAEKTTILADVATRYHLETSQQDDIANVLEGKVIGRSICHTWSEDGMKVVYNGKLEKLRAKSGMYTIVTFNVAFTSMSDKTCDFSYRRGVCVAARIDTNSSWGHRPFDHEFRLSWLEHSFIMTMKHAPCQTHANLELMIARLPSEGSQ